MFSLIVPGLEGFGLGVILLLPPMQRRAAAHDLKMPLALPVAICIVGCTAFVLGSFVNG